MLMAGCGNTLLAFGHDRGGYDGVGVGGNYYYGARAGVFGRSVLSWSHDYDDDRGFRAMAYPKPKVKTRYKLTANGGGGHAS